MTFLAIDPGKRSLAWALFVHSLLASCGFKKHKKDIFGDGLRDMLREVGEELVFIPEIVLVELPRIYPQERSKQPNDLIDLAAVAGACVVYGPIRFVHPREWKGQTPKKISNMRTRDGLSMAELKILKPWSANHNVLDAVGIGLWWRSKNA